MPFLIIFWNFASKSASCASICVDAEPPSKRKKIRNENNNDKGNNLINDL